MKAGPGGTTVYVYDAFGLLAAEYATGTSAAPCGTCYVSGDHLGSVRLVTDGNGNVVARHDYLPFGEEIPAGQAGRTSQFGATDSVNQKFTGQERDAETGLDYFQARYYGAALGRFTSPDPGNAGADLYNPQSWNGYSYVTNNPLIYIDPTGANLADWFSGIWNTISGWFGGGGSGRDPESPVIWGEQPPIDSGSGPVYPSDMVFYAWGYGRPPAPQKSGSSQTKPTNSPLTPAQFQPIKDAAKNQAGTCASEFSTGMTKFGLHFSLEAFDSQIQNIKYVQYPNIATSPLGPFDSTEANAPTRKYINLYPNFFTDTPVRQAAILVHENLHVYTGWNDSNVFSVFQKRGIMPNDVTQFLTHGNTDGITTWIVRGCK